MLLLYILGRIIAHIPLAACLVSLEIDELPHWLKVATRGAQTQDWNGLLHPLDTFWTVQFAVHLHAAEKPDAMNHVRRGAGAFKEIHFALHRGTV